MKAMCDSERCVNVTSSHRIKLMKMSTDLNPKSSSATATAMDSTFYVTADTQQPATTGNDNDADDQQEELTPSSSPPTIQKPGRKRRKETASVDKELTALIKSVVEKQESATTTVPLTTEEADKNLSHEKQLVSVGPIYYLSLEIGFRFIIRGGESISVQMGKFYQSPQTGYYFCSDSSQKISLSEAELCKMYLEISTAVKELRTLKADINTRFITIKNRRMATEETVNANQFHNSYRSHSLPPYRKQFCNSFDSLK